MEWELISMMLDMLFITHSQDQLKTIIKKLEELEEMVSFLIAEYITTPKIKYHFSFSSQKMKHLVQLKEMKVWPSSIE